MDTPMESLIVGLVTLPTALGLLYLVHQYIGLRGELEAAHSEIDALARQKADLLQGLERKDFLSRFVRELPLLTEQLHSRVSSRRIPGILLQVVIRSLEPRQALVLLRRRSAQSEPGRTARLTTAAVHPTNSSIKPGLEITMGDGELGFVAEAQLTMVREDFERETTLSRPRIKGKSLPGFRPDMAAPMVFDETTLGVIAVSGSPYQGSDAKRAMWLIAQIGAVALHNVDAYSQMKYTADVDGLTRVFNKRHLIGALGEQLYQAQKNLTNLSVFLFDIDNFKNYNDVNGHVAGDKLLRELAALVKENIREESIFGRFGGEEFLLILPGSPSSEALAVAEKLRGLIAQHDFPFAERQPLGVLSISGGVATYPTDAMDSTSLLRTADEALYAAKHQGRNKVLPAQKKYMCEGQPAMRPAKPASRPAPGPAPIPEPALPQLPENARYDQTIISQRIHIPDEEP
jgi:diguanylate cyclase (GGDEF)-like protein